MPKVTFIHVDGNRREIEAAVGQSLLDIAQANGIDIEGACEGCMACSTCHLIVDAAWYDLLEPPGEDEEFMLDLAFGLTRTSRLGCQLRLSDELDGLEVALPAETRHQVP